LAVELYEKEVDGFCSWAEELFGLVGLEKAGFCS
jgi:hypothetical protein